MGGWRGEGKKGLDVYDLGGYPIYWNAARINCTAADGCFRLRSPPPRRSSDSSSSCPSAIVRTLVLPTAARAGTGRTVPLNPYICFAPRTAAAAAVGPLARHLRVLISICRRRTRHITLVRGTDARRLRTARAQGGHGDNRDRTRTPAADCAPCRRNREDGVSVFE